MIGHVSSRPAPATAGVTEGAASDDPGRGGSGWVWPRACERLMHQQDLARTYRRRAPHLEGIPVSDPQAAGETHTRLQFRFDAADTTGRSTAAPSGKQTVAVARCPDMTLISPGSYSIVTTPSMRSAPPAGREPSSSRRGRTSSRLCWPPPGESSKAAQASEARRRPALHPDWTMHLHDHVVPYDAVLASRGKVTGAYETSGGIAATGTGPVGRCRGGRRHRCGGRCRRGLLAR